MTQQFREQPVLRVIRSARADAVFPRVPQPGKGLAIHIEGETGARIEDDTAEMLAAQAYSG